MDISVEVYENINKAEDNTVQNNYITTLHMPDYMKIDTNTNIGELDSYLAFWPSFLKPDTKKHRVTNWYHSEAVWCSPYTPLTTYDSIVLDVLFSTVVFRQFNGNINRIRVTFNKIIEK